MLVQWNDGRSSGIGTVADVALGARPPSIKTCEANGFSQAEARRLRAAHAAGAVRVLVGPFGAMTGFDRRGAEVAVPKVAHLCGPWYDRTYR